MLLPLSVATVLLLTTKGTSIPQWHKGIEIVRWHCSGVSQFSATPQRQSLRLCQSTKSVDPQVPKSCVAMGGKHGPQQETPSIQVGIVVLGPQ